MAVEAGNRVLKDLGNGSGIVTVVGGDRPITATGEQAVNAAGYKANVVNDEGHEHVGVEALECADATTSKAVNVEISDGGVQASTGAVKPAAALKHSVDRADPAPTNLVSAPKDVNISNSFAALVNESGVDRNQIVAATSTDNGQEDVEGILQHKEVRASPKNRQDMSPDSAKNQQIVPVGDSKAVAATEATPTLHIADPDLAKMIKESQAAMLMHTTPKIKASLVTLNTSVHDVLSQSLESFGERDGEFGQQHLPIPSILLFLMI
ncbi:hypothetical protein A4A49_09523 [Nicotiana attenuata]|uniref:Uncharacterized protein n=1 Tax=Nicotiana attenuata TaxID=49451 RepID=A0A314L6S7_NICAT|nr:hypothetical protein A4A49_09523 [Nicotiana attenuata]